MSNRSSLLSSVISNHAPPSQDTIAEKLLISLKQNRPNSSKSNISLRIPSAKSTASTNQFSSRTVSQIDFPSNAQQKQHQITLEIHNTQSKFDQKILENVISARGISDSEAFQFKQYPNFYENYKPSLPFKQKKLEEDRRMAGEKVIKTFNYKYYTNQLQPQNRPIKREIVENQSILTGELSSASADIALRVQELKLKQDGYEMKILKPEQRKQIIAFGKPNVMPRTISDMVQLQEAEKFQLKLEQSDILGEKMQMGKNIGKYASNAFRRGATSQLSQSQFEKSGGVMDLTNSMPPKAPY